MHEKIFWTKSSVGRFLLAMGVSTIALFAQTASTIGTTVDLGSPNLQVHATLMLNNLPGSLISKSLAQASARAVAKGMPWKGLHYTVGDTWANVVAVASDWYQKRTCQADAIVIGHSALSMAHLSANGTSVYTDYDYVIDGLLKDNKASSLQSKPDIVVTRPGGTLSLSGGPVSFEFMGFPRLQPNVTFLQFLRYIPQSSGYQPLDSLSTLVSVGTNWSLDRNPMPVTAFARGALETSVATWLKSCNQ